MDAVIVAVIPALETEVIVSCGVPSRGALLWRDTGHNRSWSGDDPRYTNNRLRWRQGKLTPGWTQPTPTRLPPQNTETRR